MISRAISGERGSRSGAKSQVSVVFHLRIAPYIRIAPPIRNISGIGGAILKGRSQTLYEGSYFDTPAERGGYGFKVAP